MATLTQRFSTLVARGFESRIGYSTSLASAPGGKEKRNQNRANALNSWIASPANKGQAETEELVKYFHAAAGRFNSFPHRDHVDYTVESGEGAVVLVTGSTYQLYKQYVIGGVTRLRKIVRPTTATIAGGGTYSAVSTSAGTFTHTGGAAPTGWTGEFDCLCRFDSDELPISVKSPDGSGGFFYSWGAIGIQEVRL